MELTLYNANVLKVKLNDGRDAYMEEQEHCDLICIGNSDGFIAGHYYFRSTDSNEVVFCFVDQEYIAKYNQANVWGVVTAYSHDYGRTWTEINNKED